MVQDSAYIVVDKDISTDESYRKQSLSNNISIADFLYIYRVEKTTECICGTIRYMRITNPALIPALISSL